MPMGSGPRSFPSVFVSHGAPTLAGESNAATDFAKRLCVEFGKTEAVLCVYARRDTPSPALSGAERPATIQDFGGDV